MQSLFLYPSHVVHNLSVLMLLSTSFFLQDLLLLIQFHNLASVPLRPIRSQNKSSRHYECRQSNWSGIQGNLFVVLLWSSSSISFESFWSHHRSFFDDENLLSDLFFYVVGKRNRRRIWCINRTYHF